QLQCPLDHLRHLRVVGGGFIGLEMAENFKRRGMEVTVVEMLEQVLPPLDPEMAEMVQRALQLHGIELILCESVAEFTRHNGRLIARLESGREIPCDMVMLSTGVKPNLELAKSAGLEIGECGGIKVNEYMQTSDPDIYAVGDAVEVVHQVTGEHTLIPLAGPANRQARIAADNICGRNVKYKGSLGTCIVKVLKRQQQQLAPTRRHLSALVCHTRSATCIHPPTLHTILVHRQCPSKCSFHQMMVECSVHK
ncbi:MAG TPA: hypothetical protein EYP10_02320, partial [Armatimonadetes bacterium]|nr:hypothetical protein [Armatimonadota bacterium]